MIFRQLTHFCNRQLSHYINTPSEQHHLCKLYLLPFCLPVFSDNWWAGHRMSVPTGNTSPLKKQPVSLIPYRPSFAALVLLQIFFSFTLLSFLSSCTYFQFHVVTKNEPLIVLSHSDIDKPNNSIL